MHCLSLSVYVWPCICVYLPEFHMNIDPSNLKRQRKWAKFEDVQLIFSEKVRFPWPLRLKIHPVLPGAFEPILDICGFLFFGRRQLQ